MLSQSQIIFIEAQAKATRCFVMYAKEVKYAVWVDFPCSNYDKILKSMAKVVAKAWANKEADEKWIHSIGHEIGILQDEMERVVKMVKVRKQNMTYL